MRELWKEIEEIRNYQVSNCGRLKHKNKIIKTRTNTQGFNIFIFNEFSENEFCVNIDNLVYKYFCNLNLIQQIIFFYILIVKKMMII